MIQCVVVTYTTTKGDIMKFTPLKFQSSLAAAGISLMSFNYLKSSVFKDATAFNLNSLSSLSLNTFDYISTILLIGIMFLFIAIHLIMTVFFLKELTVWLTSKEYKDIFKNPYANTTLFSPLISLPMSLIVIMGPLGFFISSINQNIHSLIIAVFMVFTVLWVILITLELLLVKKLIKLPIETEKLNFAWLLDVLAFGAVSLLGSSILSVSSNEMIATIIAVMTVITLFIGITLSFLKVAILFYQQFKSKSLPSIGLQPAYYLIIPPLCLLWFSVSKTLHYIGDSLSIDLSTLSFFAIVLSYTAAAIWFVFLLVFLFDYFKSSFLKSDFSPAQWGIV